MSRRSIDAGASASLSITSFAGLVERAVLTGIRTCYTHRAYVRTPQARSGDAPL